MAGFGARQNLLREMSEGGHHKVTPVELFFDLVFVFAITQLSHHLLHDLSLPGLLQTLVLFVAIWWAWIDTAWVTNWLDPDRVPVRLMLLALMLIGLVLSATLPKAFHEGALPFALAYAAFQTGRSAFTIWAVARRDPAQALNFKRILTWQAAASALWIAGAFLHDGGRLGACRGAGEHCPRHRILRAGPRRLPGFGMEGRGRAHGGTLRAARHHRAGRIHPRNRRHGLRPRLVGR